MSLWLSHEELTELTGYKQLERRRAALVSMGIKFRVRPADRFLLVERSQFEGSKTRRREPDFSALEK